VSDPVALGLVASIAHPGGNMTGPMGGFTAPKMVEFLQAIVPGLVHLALLFNPAGPELSNALLFSSVEQAASTVGIRTLRFGVRSADEFESVFAHMQDWPAQALFVVSEPLLIIPHYGLIADLAVRSRLPSVAVLRQYAEAGGLLTYAENYLANVARAAPYVDKILRGAKPGDLPIEAPTVYEFVVNFKTAQALGMSVPPGVAAQVTDWIR
jgi:putative ABC transport system substrate-binding protein